LKPVLRLYCSATKTLDFLAFIKIVCKLIPGCITLHLH